MESFDLLIVGAIAGMIAIANPSLNPIKLDASIKQPRSIASSQLQPTHRPEQSNIKARLNNELASLPPALRNAVGSIEIHANCDPEFGCKRAAATADATTRTIDVWNGGKGLAGNSMAHEAGHLLAYQKYGSYTPPGYQEVWQAEGGVSDYGDTSALEDFAEAVQQYVDGRLQSERKREFVQRALNE
jgi:hypothetical protein